VGSGERGSKIRTYHFKENRVTDHRIGLTVYKLDEILGGNLDLIIEPLREHWKKEKLASLGN
jgi:peptide chain release factor 1